MKAHIITIDGHTTDHERPLVEMVVNNDGALGDAGQYAVGSMALNTATKKLFMVALNGDDEVAWLEVSK